MTQNIKTKSQNKLFLLSFQENMVNLEREDLVIKRRLDYSKNIIIYMVKEISLKQDFSN